MTVAALIVGGITFYALSQTNDVRCLWALVLLVPICALAWKTETNQVEQPDSGIELEVGR